MLFRRGLLVLAGLAVLIPLHAAAQDSGQKLYLKYCSACHGPTGKGDGVVSSMMDPKPTNLTLMARRAEGKFPFQEALRAIDGRQTVRAHGDPDMPVWGDIFKGDESDPAKGEAVAKGRAAMITEYLSTIQDWK